MDQDNPRDLLAEAEDYLNAVHSGSRVLGGGAGDERDDPRVALSTLLDRLARLDRVTEDLAPRGGRQAARLRSLLIGERASIYVGIGATIARWRGRGGDVSLVMDPERTAVRPALRSIDESLDEPEGSVEATLLPPNSVQARIARQPPPAAASPSLASVLAETRRAVRPVRPSLTEGPPPDILGSDPGVPPEDASPEALAAEAEWLDDQGNQLHRWRRSSAPLQHAVLSWLTARARWAQELFGPGEQSEGVARLYPRLSAFSKRERPGFVYGLRRDHAPQAGTWRDDAQSWRRQVTELSAQEGEASPEDSEGSNPERALLRLDEILRGDPEDQTITRAVAATLDAGVRPDDPRLLRLLEEHDDSLAGDPRFKRLRRALRAFASEDDADATVVGDLDLLDSSLFGEVESLTPEEVATRDAMARELRVLLVGGEPREQHRQRLLDATGVRELEWAPATRGGGTGKLQSTAESIRQGSWDGVILLPRFCGHDVDAVLVPACKTSETPWLHVRGGYGVGPMRAAVRELAGRLRDIRDNSSRGESLS